MRAFVLILCVLAASTTLATPTTKLCHDTKEIIYKQVEEEECHRVHKQVCEYHTVYEEVCHEERVKVCENFWKEDGYGGKIWTEDPSKCHWLDQSQCVKTPKPKKECRDEPILECQKIHKNIPHQVTCEVCGDERHCQELLPVWGVVPDQHRDAQECHCLPPSKCPAFRKLAEEKKFDELHMALHIKQKRCGFENMQIHLCCPQNGAEEAAKPIKDVVDLNEDDQNKICMRDHEDLLATKSYECGMPELSLRIVGGEDAESHEYPWAAAIAYNDPNFDEPEYQCTGFLIHEQYVITAAHCVGEDNGTLVDNFAHVFLGHADLFDPCGVEVKIESAIQHPDYSFDPVLVPVNDIALLKLAEPVEIGPTINTLCLPSPDEDIDEVQEPYVVGWGFTDVEKEILPNVLQELELRIVPNDNCTEVYRELFRQDGNETIASTFNILESHICAEGLSFGKDSCNGDSGGPVMSLNPKFQYVARGLVSFGGGKCDSGFPALYTRVSKYLGWIDSVINDQ